MSNTIQAAIHTDPELSAIRTMVGGKNDGIPFTLFPVRIETRFMLVDKPIRTRDTFPEVLIDISKIIRIYVEVPPGPQPPEFITSLKEATFLAEGLLTKINAISRLSIADKEVLSANLNALETQAKKLTPGLSSAGMKAAKSNNESAQLHLQVLAYTQQAQKAASVLLPAQHAVHEDAAEFLSELNAIRTTIKDLAGKQLAKLDYKAKRRAFAEIERKLGVLEQDMLKVRKRTTGNLSASPEQLIQLEEILAWLNPGFAILLKNFETLDSAYKQAEYTARVSRIGLAMGELKKEIETLIQPRMSLRNGLQMTDARKILHHAQEVLHVARRANAAPPENYKAVKRLREELFRGLERLKQDAEKIIEGNAEDFEAVHAVWDSADQALTQLAKRLASIKGTGDAEKKAIAEMVDAIREEYQADLSGLKPGVKSGIPLLTNKTLEKNVSIYEQTIREMKRILTRIKDSTGSDDEVLRFLKSMRDVEALEQKFVADARELHIVPEARLKELKELSARLDGTVKGKAKSLQIHLPKTVTDATNSIRATANEQISDRADRKEKYKAEGRSGIAAVIRTETKKELWVRIYPDDIAVHAHEEALTEVEIESGKAYWYEIWAAGTDKELKLAAWRAISTAYGPERAAWIVKSLEPVAPELAQNAFASVSEHLLNANLLLGKVHAQLDAGIKQRKDVFEVLAAVSNPLKEAETLLGRTTADSETLLRKTRDLLHKNRSKLAQYIETVQRLKSTDKKSAGERMLLAKNVNDTFGNTINNFRKIRASKAKEINNRISTLKVFPEVEVKDKNWTKAPHSRIMPDRFVVGAMRSGVFHYLEAGSTLPTGELVVGLDPATFNGESFAYDADKNLIVADSIKWLTDFEEAKSKGMALSFGLNDDDWNYGFDKLFVLGVKNTSATQGKNLVESLINNHHYLPLGASFIPVGTPTNNTKSGEAGFKSFDTDAARSFRVERDSEEGDSFSPNTHYPSDSERLAAALGVDQRVFRHLDNSTTTGVSDALNMNKALFHGTLGAYMEEGLDTLFNLDNINRTKTFFTNYVSGRGYLPSIRIGTQPYGILPVSALSRFQCSANDGAMPQLQKTDFGNPAAIENQLQTRFEIRLKNLLALLNNQWTTIRSASVKHSGNMSAAPDPQAYFMDMLGLDATSVEQYFRYGLNVASRQGNGEVGEFSINFDPADPFSPNNVALLFRNHIAQGYYYKSDNFLDESHASYNTLPYKYNRIQTQFNEARVFYIRHLQEQAQLLGHEIDHRTLSDALQAASPIAGTAEERLQAQGEVANYVNWMLNSNPWTVHASNRFAEVSGSTVTDGMPSKSLLFLLLRHSLLSAYADTMMKVLEHEGLLTQPIRKQLGQAKHYLTPVEGHMRYVTKWNFLFGKIGPMKRVLGNNMDESNAFYAYMNNNDYYLNRYVSPQHPSVFSGYAFHNNHNSYIAELNRTRNAISKLKDIPTAHLDHLLSEHLDLCSYRMDAWYLGLVNKRLTEQRNSHASGTYIGAYGWVEKLRRGADLQSARNVPSGLWKSGDAPVYTDGDNQGYIHTPSLNHAITAAILRAGFKANAAIAEAENQMAVNLSSARVRTALNLLSGIRGGQEAGALLGYQFERGLHERYQHVVPALELDEYIYDFRESFPLSAPVSGTTLDPEIARTMVVNGMDLLEFAQSVIEDNGGPLSDTDSVYQSLKNFETQFWSALGNTNLSNATAAERDAMLCEIDRMADAFDALGDLCIAESVYQVAQGNHVRASAILDKLSKGDVPNDITIADTPRTGTVVTHKVAMFVDRIAGVDRALTAADPLPWADAAIDAAVTAAGAQAAGWNARFTPRALLEPTLNKWIGEMIGDPAHIKCVVEYSIVTDSTQIDDSVTVSIADLELQPLDILHLFATGAMNGGTELNTRLANHARAQISSLPSDWTGTVDDVPVRIRYTERDASWSADDFSFYEKSGYILSLRTLLTSSGILSADHLHIPGEEPVSADEVRNQDVNELLIRIENANARLQAVSDALDAFFTAQIDPEEASAHTYTTGEVDTLRTLLTEASAFGIAGSLPELQVSYTDAAGQALMLSAISVYKATLDRLHRAAADIEKGKDVSLPNDARVDALVQAARVIMEPSFRVWPQFTLRNATQLSGQLALPVNQGLLRGADPHAMDAWSQGIGRVRERMAGLDTLQMMAENFEMPLPDMHVAQLPFTLDSGGNAADHWLGLPYPEGYQPTEDKLSMVIMNSPAISTAGTEKKVGLLIDDWVEIIPNQQETTGLTFNYDQPDAKAPNTILVAVTPQVTGHWSWDDLMITLDDTLELCKNRAVEPEHLENTVFGQIVPGMLTEIVPPQLIPPPEETESNPLGYQVVTDFKVNNDTYVPETES